MVGLWRQLTRGLRALTDRRSTDREIADEVAHYLEEATRAHIARGLTPAAAARAARLELGGETRVREEVRDYGWENRVEALLADVRVAVRQLRSSPGFTAVALLTLALGIGGTTAIFSAIKPVLFEPLPYPGAGDVRVIQEVTSDGGRRDGTFGMYHGLAERARSFEAMAVVRAWRPTMTGRAEPERLEGQRVSAGWFRVLGVAPALGRDFAASEDRAGGPDVVIVSDGLWRRLGGDPAILGEPIRLDDREHIVVGVMPAAFENVVAPGAELWAPLQYDLREGRAWGHHLRTFGRLRPGASPEEATREVNAVGPAVAEEHGASTYGDFVAWITPSLQSDITRAVRPGLLAILGAVVVVLVIACINVTNLLLARGVRRRSEFALRTALGAGRGRIARQLLTESLVLALAGGVLGMALAAVGVRALVAVVPPGLPRADAIGVDAAVFLFGFGVTALVGVAFGLVPALRASGREHRDLQQGSQRAAGRGRGRLRGSLVVAQVSLALVLLVGSGLLFRSLQHLFAVPAGFDAEQVLTMQIQASGQRSASDEETWRFFEGVLEAVRGVPGVTAAALTSQLPLSGDFDQWGVHFESGAAPRAGEEGGVFRYAVTPGYIETLSIPLRHGRALTDRDGAGAPLVALVNESLARHRFAGVDPVGQRLRIGATDSPPYTVVGVVADVKQQSLALERSDAVYVRTSQWRFADRVMTLVVRGPGDVATLAPALRSAIWSVDPDQPVVRVARLDELVAASAAERRFALILFQAFALTALLLAAAGIHGVIGGSVAERTRELGIRSALGARRGDVLALVLGQGLRLTLLGVAIGLIGAAAASRVIGTLLFGVSPLDPTTYAAVVVLLVAVAVMASAAPAWRAARIDPAITLRAE